MNRKGSILKPFCKYGHDVSIKGRNTQNYCRACGYLYNARWAAHKAKAKEVPCSDCGIQYKHWQMEFDHLKDKKFTIGDTHCSIKVLKQEIKKCEVVYANCHANRTWRRSHDQTK